MQTVNRLNSYIDQVTAGHYKFQLELGNDLIYPPLFDIKIYNLAEVYIHCIFSFVFIVTDKNFIDIMKKMILARKNVNIKLLANSLMWNYKIIS